MGAGVLGYPFCFRSSGLLLGSLVMLVSCLATRFSYNLLLYCSQISNKRSYEELAEQALGKGGRQLVELCTAALNLGCIVAYLNILADVLSTVAGTIIPPGAEPSRNAYIIGVSVFGALPVALLVRDHATIAAFSVASVGFAALFAVVILGLALAGLPAAAAAGAAANELVLWRPEGLLVSFPVIVFSFTAHPYYLGIFNSMAGPTFMRMTKVTDVAMGLCGLIYWVVGTGGYLAFRNRTAGDLLRNLGAAHVDGLRGAYERALKLCYGLSILGAVPLVILPFYSIMTQLVAGPTRHEGPGSAPGMKRRTSSSGGGDDENSGDGQSMVHARMPAGSHSSVGGAMGRRSTGARPERSGGSGSGAAPDVDVVGLKLHHAGGGDWGGGADNEELPFGKHAIIVILVLGASLASAIWLPNIEFIFGLTGATASVLLSYILPAFTFIRLLDATPELLGGGKIKVMPEAVRLEWLWRKRKAIALLCFGVVSGIAATDATLGAVQQEAAVVALAQQLVAHEVVVAETAAVQAKARQAVTAVGAVEVATAELGRVHAGAASTLAALARTVAELESVTGGAVQVAAHDWGISHLVQGHRQHAEQARVYKNAEGVLSDAVAELAREETGVAGVVARLDAALAALRSEAEAGEESGQGAAAAHAGAAGDAGAAAGMHDGSGGGSEAARVGAKGSGSGGSSKAAAGSSSSGSGAGGARSRAADLAVELGKALGAGAGSGNATTLAAGKPLSASRSAALSAQSALRQAATALDRAGSAVEAARRGGGGRRGEEARAGALAAVRGALNATATAARALQLTDEALQRAAQEEAGELVGMLVKVSKDLEKTSAKAKVPRVKREGGNGTSAAAGSASAGASGGVLAGAGAAAPAGSAGATARTGSMGSLGRAGGAGAGRTGTGKGTAAGGGATGTGASAGRSTGGSGAGGIAGAAQAPGASSDVRSAEAAGQLEKVIKDLNNKIAAAGGAGGAAAAASSAIAAAAAAEEAAAAAAAAAVAAGGDTEGVSSHASHPPPPPSKTSHSAHSTTHSGSTTSTSTITTTGHNHNTTTGTAGGTALATNATSGAVSGVDVGGIAAALADAVALTREKQAEALERIQDSLQRSDSKVAERVVDIIKDMGEAKKEAEAAKGAASSAAAAAASAATGAAGGAALLPGGGDAAALAAAEEAAAGGVSAAGSGAAAGAVGAGAAGGEDSAGLLGLGIGLVKALSAGEEEGAGTAVGPVVRVDMAGHLVQEGGDGDGVVGPVVRDGDQGSGERGQEAGAGEGKEAREEKDREVGGEQADEGGVKGDGSGERGEVAEGSRGGEGLGSGGEGRQHRKLGLGTLGLAAGG